MKLIFDPKWPKRSRIQGGKQRIASPQGKRKKGREAGTATQLFQSNQPRTEVGELIDRAVQQRADEMCDRYVYCCYDVVPVASASSLSKLNGWKAYPSAWKTEMHTQTQ